MRRPLGYSIISNADGWGSTIEQDTYTCFHCNKVGFLKPRQEPEHRCKSCFGYICPACANKPCLPLEEQLRMMESASYRPRKIFRMRI
jgi:hypothetical protein